MQNMLHWVYFKLTWRVQIALSKECECKLTSRVQIALSRECECKLHSQMSASAKCTHECKLHSLKSASAKKECECKIECECKKSAICTRTHECKLHSHSRVRVQVRVQFALFERVLPTLWNAFSIFPTNFEPTHLEWPRKVAFQMRPMVFDGETALVRPHRSRGHHDFRHNELQSRHIYGSGCYTKR